MNVYKWSHICYTPSRKLYMSYDPMLDWTKKKKKNLLHTHIYAKENIRKKCDTVLEKLEILFSSIYHSTLCNSINITI